MKLDWFPPKNNLETKQCWIPALVVKVEKVKESDNKKEKVGTEVKWYKSE